MPRKSLRQASKEALKQMQLLSQSYGNEDDPPDADDDDSIDPTETFEITSDEEKEDEPPKKKYRTNKGRLDMLETSSHSSSPSIVKGKSDLQDNQNTSNTSIATRDREKNSPRTIRDEIVLTLDAWIEELTDVQKAARNKLEQEYKELTSKIEQITKSAEVIFQGEVHSAFELENSIPPLTYTSDGKKKSNAVKTKPTQSPTIPNLMYQSNKTNPANYQLVMDPRLGLIVGTMTPTTPGVPATIQSPVPSQSRQTRQRGKNVQTPSPVPTASKQTKPASSSSIGIMSKGSQNKTNNKSAGVVDLTSEEALSRPAADSKEISFNKLQGKTYPSLVVVARPHLNVKDISGGDRTKLDAKVKSVLMYVPTKFTEWLIQQGLVRSEQCCVTHPSSKLKLGMYSDASKFPYSGGYVWISECCPTRFVSVFSGSLFEGSSHPPSVILKLIYHWSCQTNIQNVVQWVKVENIYVKGINTLLRGICTAALHSHIQLLGGPGQRVEVGVISLGTTTQDGLQRQVKVEVLGVLETETKHIRLRAIEPLAEADRNYKKRFAKILEPLNEWIHKESLIITDLTVDKQTLSGMGYTNIQQATSSDTQNSNQTVMEYLRRIVPRMFQNTLSLLSRQIIQQFLDELVWREWYGTTAAQCFDNVLTHIAEQTRAELTSGESLIVRLNKVAANPFRNWSFKPITKHLTNNKSPNHNTPEPNHNDASLKKGINRSTKKIMNTPSRDRDSSSPDSSARAISPDVPQQLVPLENYYYGTINAPDEPEVTKCSNWNMKCSMCKSQFSNNIKLMTHLFTHAHNVTGNVFQCQYCLSSVGSQEGLTKHVFTSHPVETKFLDGYVCIICEQRFPNTFSLGKHLSREHVPAELPYSCGSCTFKCSSHRQAVDHFYSKHSASTTIQCPFCLKSTTIVTSGRILSQNLNFFLQHLQKHQKKALARKCPKCALWFINKDTLKDHQINMHLSQRMKTGLTPWPCPRNGVMVPKSKSDIQVWEDSEREFNVANVTINNLPSKSLCKECKNSLHPTGHFQSCEGCPNQSCQYETFCKGAMENHAAICKDLNLSLPISTLAKVMYCVCGYSDSDGNTLAKHLAQCERKSAYPTAEAAKKAIKTHSMLDVLGLVRRPEEPSKSSETEAEDIDNNQVNQTNDNEEIDVQMKDEKKVPKKVGRKKKKVDTENEEETIEEKQNDEEVQEFDDKNEEKEEKRPSRTSKRKRKAEEDLTEETDNKVEEIPVNKQKKTEQIESILIDDEDEQDNNSSKTSNKKRKADGDVSEDEEQKQNEEQTIDEVQNIEKPVKSGRGRKKKKTEEEIVQEISERRKKSIQNSVAAIRTRSKRNDESESDSSPPIIDYEDSNSADNNCIVIEDAETNISQEDDNSNNSQEDPDVAIIENISQDDTDSNNSQEDVTIIENINANEGTVVDDDHVGNEERDEQTDDVQEIEEVDEIALQLEALERGDYNLDNKVVGTTEDQDGSNIVEPHAVEESDTSEVNKATDLHNSTNIENEDTMDEQIEKQQTEEVSDEESAVEAYEKQKLKYEVVPIDVGKHTNVSDDLCNEAELEMHLGQIHDNESELLSKVNSAEFVKSHEPPSKLLSDVDNAEPVKSQEEQSVVGTADPVKSPGTMSELLSKSDSAEPVKSLETDAEHLSKVDRPEHVNTPEIPTAESAVPVKSPETQTEFLSKIDSPGPVKSPETQSELIPAAETVWKSPETETEFVSNAEPVTSPETLSEIGGTESTLSHNEDETDSSKVESATLEVPHTVMDDTESKGSLIDDISPQKLEQDQEMEMNEIEQHSPELEEELFHTPEEVHEVDELEHKQQDEVPYTVVEIDDDSNPTHPETDFLESERNTPNIPFDDLSNDVQQSNESASEIFNIDDNTNETENDVHQSNESASEIFNIDDNTNETANDVHQSNENACEIYNIDDDTNETANNDIHEISEVDTNDIDRYDEIDDEDLETAEVDQQLSEVDTENKNQDASEIGMDFVELDDSEESKTEDASKLVENPDPKDVPSDEVPDVIENLIEHIPEHETESPQLEGHYDEVSQETENFDEIISKEGYEGQSGKASKFEASSLITTHDSIFEDQQNFNKPSETILNDNSVPAQNHEILSNSVPVDVEENLENIQKELFGYTEKQSDLIDKDSMEVDLPDIFGDLGQNNVIGEDAIGSTAFDSSMVVDNFDTGIEHQEDNTKMLEDIIKNIQTDAL